MTRPPGTPKSRVEPAEASFARINIDRAAQLALFGARVTVVNDFIRAVDVDPRGNRGRGRPGWGSGLGARARGAQARPACSNAARVGAMVAVGPTTPAIASRVFRPSPVLNTTVSASGSS